MTRPEAPRGEHPGTGAPEAPDPARISFRPVRPTADAELLHRWVTHPKSSFWLMSQASRADVERAYAEVEASPYQAAFIGEYGTWPYGRERYGTPPGEAAGEAPYGGGPRRPEPVCLMERYDPAHVELPGLYEPEPGDVGMHFLVAPAGPGTPPVHGFTRAVITAVLAELFADPSVRRIVVEPDVRNTAVQRLNAAVGFVPVRVVRKPEKDALLSTCTREQFEAAR